MENIKLTSCAYNTQNGTVYVYINDEYKKHIIYFDKLTKKYFIKIENSFHFFNEEEQQKINTFINQ